MECGRGLEAVINLSKKMIDYMAELSFYHYYQTLNFGTLTG